MAISSVSNTPASTGLKGTVLKQMVKDNVITKEQKDQIKEAMHTAKASLDPNTSKKGVDNNAVIDSLVSNETLSTAQADQIKATLQEAINRRHLTSPTLMPVGNEG